MLGVGDARIAYTSALHLTGQVTHCPVEIHTEGYVGHRLEWMARFTFLLDGCSTAEDWIALAQLSSPRVQDHSQYVLAIRRIRVQLVQHVISLS